ncbi:phosphate import ATP-binding protein PstB [Meiothermus granaticius NBRC 107808]|uniref:Phosphate import ATP-binding protein PstB 1 n=2 Tax=Meiothermus TaxID=65551 RepID=A0A399FCT4_9DEIN|nr:Phosphate import ATP-binding protein PstB 1 [Meiothermus granaticius NBRC 107808]GEM88293.1 phosphate import ATP-binding protein PstB [Meiothermus granaticius NBRC 107808]
MEETSVPKFFMRDGALELSSTKELVHLEARDLSVYYGKRVGVGRVNLSLYRNRVTAFIGPSGCGKTTFLRSLNRMHDLTPNVRVQGQVLLDGSDIYGPGTDPIQIRRRIGMVFQKPTAFPTLSVYDNVVAGLKMVGLRDRKRLDEAAERSLQQAALWDEVKDRLRAPAAGLSGGQQQRLTIARALAVEPEILLMDEPTASLDPISTQAIEDLLGTLKQQVTIAIVTHNMQQAARISDYTAYFLNGELIEMDSTSKMFTKPNDKRTEAYITGRFG